MKVSRDGSAKLFSWSWGAPLQESLRKSLRCVCLSLSENYLLRESPSRKWGQCFSDYAIVAFMVLSLKQHWGGLDKGWCCIPFSCSSVEVLVLCIPLQWTGSIGAGCRCYPWQIGCCGHVMRTTGSPPHIFRRVVPFHKHLTPELSGARFWLVDRLHSRHHGIDSGQLTTITDLTMEEQIDSHRRHC